MKLTKIRRNKERGVAMLMALLALVLLAIIGIGFMFMSVTENSVNNNFKDSQKAYFAARAGLENVRTLLTAPNPTTGLGAGPLYGPALALDGNMPTKLAPTGVIYVKNSSIAAATDVDPTTGLGNTVALNPTLDDELCHEKFGLLGMTAGTAATPCGATGAGTELMASVPAYFTPIVSPASGIINSGQPSALAFKWVRITNKQNFMGLVSQTVSAAQPVGNQVCWDGAKEQVIPPGATCVLPVGAIGTDMRPVWLLTALAVTPQIGQNPGSRRIVQMEVALAPPIRTNATVATQSPISLKGQLTVGGNDSCTCDSSGNPLVKGGTCDKSHLAVYTGAPFCDSSGVCSQGINPNGIPAENITGNNGQTGVTQYNTTTGAVTTLGATGQGAWPYDVPTLIQNYSSGATNASTTSPWNFTCNQVKGSFADCGTQTGQAFGQYPTSGSPPDPTTGTPQVVYVPGSVHLSGNTSGDGVLIIDGDLEVKGGLNFYGLILVRGSISFTGGGSQPVNLYGAILAGKDVSASDSIGGSFNFQYNSCALKQSALQQPPKLLATHEIMY